MHCFNLSFCKLMAIHIGNNLFLFSHPISRDASLFRHSMFQGIIYENKWDIKVLQCLEYFVQCKIIHNLFSAIKSHPRYFCVSICVSFCEKEIRYGHEIFIDMYWYLFLDKTPMFATKLCKLNKQESVSCNDFYINW